MLEKVCGNMRGEIVAVAGIGGLLNPKSGRPGQAPDHRRVRAICLLG